MTNPLLDARARIVIAHRGNRVRAPENTIASLAEAVELGADALEFDVRVTRDGIAVLMHDATLDRTTDGRGRVRDHGLEEIETFDAAARVQGWRGREGVPTLEETLDRFRAVPLVIEVKEVDAVEPTESLVRRMGIQDRVLLGSADAVTAARLYRSGLRTCASMSDAMRLIPRALVGGRPSRPVYDVLSVPPRYRGIPIPATSLAIAALKAGIPTHVWTVNHPATARAYWRGGVSGIVTDDPEAMLRLRSAGFDDA